MPVTSANKYLNTLLEHLVTTYETEINYTPIAIRLDPQSISDIDIPLLLQFIKAPRKRLFIFEHPYDQATSNQLALTARRAVLNQTATITLESTSNEPKINPLKLALSNPQLVVRPNIQIQKSFVVPQQPVIIEEVQQQQHVERVILPDPVLIPIQIPELPVLTNQLKSLGITALEDTAAQKIKEHLHAFTDGIIPNNLPKGFYINAEAKALCYTDTPRTIPTALAPALEKSILIAEPTPEDAWALLPNTIDSTTLNNLLNAKKPIAQRKALLSVLNEHATEIRSFLQGLPSALEFISPLLAKQFILGGEAHACLFTRLLTNCLNKKLSLDFLKKPAAQAAFFSPRGMKNLQKLLQLPAEQKEWWNTLVCAHLKNETHHFDFNTFFEAYSQIFLPRIVEKNLSLPQPCPIQHQGHILTTLNRVLEVLEQAKNPQEQVLNLANLNWSPTGVHHAMTQAPKIERFKQVAACMRLETIEDTQSYSEDIHPQLENESFSLEPWLFRYMGQHWKEAIRLTDIQDQLKEIQNLVTWTPVQKNQLRFILTTTFSDSTGITAEEWKKNLKETIGLLEPLTKEDRSVLLQALSSCYQFKPCPSLSTINKLIKQCIELKTTFPTKNFKNELVLPLTSCLTHEGFEVLSSLQERILKTDASQDNLYSLTAINTFTTTIQDFRDHASLHFIKLLAKLDEPKLDHPLVKALLISFKELENIKKAPYIERLLTLLSQINISKSQPLPNILHIKNLLTELAKLPDLMPEVTEEKQEQWLKDLILDKNLLPGCALGNGDISKLDDLIVDALADSVKKRGNAFKNAPWVKGQLAKYAYPIIPTYLKDQVEATLIPVLDAVHELVLLLNEPNPSFNNVFEKLRIFEEQKPKLLNASYAPGLGLGASTGANLLSLLFTRKKKPEDNITSYFMQKAIEQMHDQFYAITVAFFNDEKNKKSIRDIDVPTCIKWMTAFNDTHTLTFFFKEELLQKKIVPALRKTLQQLNTRDLVFEKNILDAAQEITENEPAHLALRRYKEKIEGIASYLNLLIVLKDEDPRQFDAVYQQLNTGSMARLDYTQKQRLVNELRRSKSLDAYLKLTAQILDENPRANSEAIERAIKGIITLFELPDLEPETRAIFFRMSMVHNLRNAAPFPLATLIDFKKSALPPETKSVIIKEVIRLLSQISSGESSELIEGVIQHTQHFLTNNPQQLPLCLALLKRVSLNSLNRDLTAYPNILSQVSLLSDSKEIISTILTGLANRKKDYTVNLSTLLEISKGLARRTNPDLKQVVQLFATPPYPIAQNLNFALMAHGSEKLHAYCSNFDKNPFAKTNEKRDFAKHFATDRVQEALFSLKDLIQDQDIPHDVQLRLARQLTYIETLGYTDPLNPDDFKEAKNLTLLSRHHLKERACALLQQMRLKTIAPEDLEITQLELLAYLREIYFRTTGLFPNTTQILVLLLSLHMPSTNLLMRIKTGEGKSINTPMLSVLQWAQGGTVDQCTANPTLLLRDYENNCEPFFNFLDIKSSLIQPDSEPKDYRLDGINCSTIEGMAIFRLTTKELKQEHLIQNKNPIHVVLDECDDALLDQKTLFKLVAENTVNEGDNNAQWVYPLAYKFIRLPAFRNIDTLKGEVWDEEEDLEQFRLFLNKEINGDANKQNFLMKTSNTQLAQWINASCKAASYIENRHFIVQPIKEKDEAGNSIIKKIVCVPLIRSTPKTGSIFPEGVQHALQARLIAERKDEAQYIFIDRDPPVLASQSAPGLVRFYQNTKGRILGISATPGDQPELKGLATLLGTQSLGVAPYAGDKRKKHDPVFTFTHEERVQAIHAAIDKVILPITKPNLEFEGDTDVQTYDEQEALIAQRNNAKEQWSLTQTQPMLIINEDFDEARTLGESFTKYKNAGFKIQIVTGKEDHVELDRIIKQAGQANTITVGTAMLAKGIDINTGNHPKGLLVIQTYPDTERMTTQIAGRAARNGKPGEWLPVYQINPPQTLLEKALYYIFPWYRQSINEYNVEKLKAKIKLQASIDRLYTQGIDEAQQTLMLQIDAWENLLLDINPKDQKLIAKLYQWREKLFSELTRIQETELSQQTLESSIHKFKKSACQLWETLREEQWAAEAQKLNALSPKQILRLNYLKQLDLAQEFNAQSALQNQNKLFASANDALKQQSLDTIIRDKAGAVLHYGDKKSDAEKMNLKFAQSKQLLPHLIGEFCSTYPRAIKSLIPQKTSKPLSYLPEILISLVEKVIERKNKVLLTDQEQQQITQSIIEYYQKELVKADLKTIQDLLEKLKPLILSHCKDLTQSSLFTKISLVEQFKMQGLVLNFTALYQNSGLAEDPELAALKLSYNEELMKKLADHLLNELAWIKKLPEPLHILIERTAAKNAARVIHRLASEVKSSPQNAEKIQALYKGLQEQRLILKDLYMFSIGHSSPRDTINVALDAIDALNVVPHCAPKFRDQCHDQVLSEYYLKQFREYLNYTESSWHAKDPVWVHLKKTLNEISLKSDANQIHRIHELSQAVERYKTYNAYASYKGQLASLSEHLTQSIAILENEEKLKQDPEESLFNQKTAELATLFKVNAKQVRIQKGTDGLQSYIELQVENAPLQEGFKGYQSSFFANLNREKGIVSKRKASLGLSTIDLLALKALPPEGILAPKKLAEFKKLFELKALLEAQGVDAFEQTIGQFPEEIQKAFSHYKKISADNNELENDLKHFDGILKADVIVIGSVEEIETKKALIKKFNEQSTLTKKLADIRDKKTTANEQIEAEMKKMGDLVDLIKKATIRRSEPDCGFSEKLDLGLKIVKMNSQITYSELPLSRLERSLTQVNKEETQCEEDLIAVKQAIHSDKNKFMGIVKKKIAKLIENHFLDVCKKLVDSAQLEFQAEEASIESIEREESKKSLYQTRRFFNPTELLSFEASLANEQQLIPKQVATPEYHDENEYNDEYSDSEQESLAI